LSRFEFEVILFVRENDYIHEDFFFLLKTPTKKGPGLLLI